METILLFALTALISLCGGLIARRIGLMAPLQMGGILAVAVFSAATGHAQSLPWLSFFLQVVAGTLFGCSIHRKEVSGLRSLSVPALLIVSGMMLINLIMGNIIRLISGIDSLTGYLCCIPGGVTESVVIAESMGGDVPTVALFQLVRTVSATLLFPIITVSLTKAERRTDAAGGAKKKTEYEVRKVLLTICCGIAGGLVGKILPIPAGSLVFSMIAVAIMNVKTSVAQLPKGFKTVAQVLTGVYVGSRVTRAYVSAMSSMILPLIVMVCCYLLFDTLLGLLIARVCHKDRMTMLFSCTPAGASDIALIASDYLESEGGVAIALLHIVRLSSCIVLFPWSIRFAVMLFG